MSHPSRTAMPLVALGLSMLLVFGPLVQPAAAQTVTVTVGNTTTIHGTPTPNSINLGPPPSSTIQVSSCSGPRRIFQNCPLGGPLESRLEAQAIDGVVRLNHLSDSDKARVLSWARNEVRAVLFNNLVAAYKKDASQRSADEAAAVSGMTQAVRLKRVTAATTALDEFNKWSKDPCRYTPPTGFTYDRGTACTRGANQLFGGANPPSRADFEAYGAASAYGRFASDASLRSLSGDTAKAYGTLAGLGAAAAAGGTAGVVGSTLSVGTLAAIQPFLVSGIVVSQHGIAVLGSAGAALASKATTAAAASSAGASGAISLAGPVAIVVTAIVIGVVQGINVVKAAELPGQLQSDFNDAKRYDPTSGVRTSGEAATRELYAAFLDMTLPDFPGSEPVPAPQSADPKLLIGGAAGAMQYLDWTESRHTARLSGDWWVDTDATGKSRLTLTVDYRDAAGQGWTASRRGTEFVLRRAGNSALASDMTAEVLGFQDWQRQSRSASLVTAGATTAQRTPTNARVDAVPPRGPYVIVDPTSQALASGTNTTLQVDASAGAGQLASWSAEITYDPAVLQVSGCAPVAPGTCSPRFGPHTVRIDGGTATPRAGPLTLARITFTAVGARGAPSTIGIKVISLTDPNQKPFSAATGPGQVQIE